MEDDKSYSRKFYERYRELYKKDFERFLETMDRKLYHSFRANTLKVSPDELASSLTDKGFVLAPYGDGGYFRVDSAPFSLSSTGEHLQGMLYIQGLAEMAVSPQLGCAPGERVWDMCAAPGGKTTHMAGMMGNRGVIVATDVSPEKAKALKNNIARLGVTNTMVFRRDARRMRSPSQYDRILLDAPCTGSGIIRKDPSRKGSRTMEDIWFMQSIQKGLMENASRSLKEGGTMLYSTCSLEPEENEMLIDWTIGNLPLEIVPLERGFLEISPGFQHPFGKDLDPSIALCGRIHPHINDTNGMFLAKLRKL